MKKYVFKRYEYKYLIPYAKYEKIKEFVASRLTEDEHGITTIQSLYLDNDFHLLIRTSMDKPIYKEKIRLRSYGLADESKDVFLELKKKYKGLVYKRRISVKEQEVVDFFTNNGRLKDGQIEEEIAYFKEYYQGLKPKMLLIYDREAYYDKESDLRVTFDHNIRYRVTDLNLHTNLNGVKLIEDDLVLMEIKSAVAIPFELARFLSENEVYRRPFSKYATAYKKEYFGR